MAVTVDATVPDSWEVGGICRGRRGGPDDRPEAVPQFGPEPPSRFACCLYAHDITMRSSSTRAPNATVDLDGQRFASNLGDLDQGEQAGAVA
jgi:hypothetical protein